MQLTIQSKVKLNNGVQMPLFGFGTYQLLTTDMKTALTAALEDGYIHIDTACVYRNEESIGVVLKDLFQAGTYKREDLFITSKLATADQGYDKAIQACNLSLTKLGIDYLDLYLIHWPGTAGHPTSSPQNSINRTESWRALETLYEEKKCRSIGVSNYTIKHLEELLSKSKIVPQVNQVEFHPFLFQKELLDYCRSKDIQLEAYSSLVRHEDFAFANETITKIAQNHSKLPSQVLLRWAIQHNIPVIPKSKTPSRIKENSQLFDFELTEDEMKQLDALNADKRICWDPNTVA